MPRIKFNPGHSYELEKIAVFEKGQRDTGVREHIQNAIKEGQIAETFFLLENQLKNDHIAYELVEILLDSALEASQELNDQESIENVEKELTSARDIFYFLTQQRESSATFCEEVSERLLIDPMFLRKYTPEAEERRVSLLEAQKAFSLTWEDSGPKLIEKVLTTEDRLNEAKSRLL
jgi:hypothetical protein